MNPGPFSHEATAPTNLSPKRFMLVATQMILSCFERKGRVSAVAASYSPSLSSLISLPVILIFPLVKCVQGFGGSLGRLSSTLGDLGSTLGDLGSTFGDLV